ncbi:hypothetical protein BJ741DRAFT_660215 [Chytriomyces cf. hyalinus JEL632]|nr:hypothetical protein BJ741DRAFT_660215 [Chytriomyces cf. hyalinus JEL632]
MNNRLGGTCINLPNLDTCGPGLVCLNSACRLASNPSTTTQRTRSTLVTTLTSPRTTISHTSSSVATIAPASDKNKAAKSTNVSIVPPVSKTGAIVGGICAVLSTVLIAGLVWFYRGPSGNDEDAQELKRKGEHSSNYTRALPPPPMSKHQTGETTAAKPRQPTAPSSNRLSAILFDTCNRTTAAVTAQQAVHKSGDASAHEKAPLLKHDTASTASKAASSASCTDSASSNADLMNTLHNYFGI